MTEINDMMSWMINPMSIMLQKTGDFTDAHKRLLKSQAEMLSAMAAYSQAVMNFYTVMMAPDTETASKDD